MPRDTERGREGEMERERERERDGENFNMKKAPLLRRAALKTQKNHMIIIFILMVQYCNITYLVKDRCILYNPCQPMSSLCWGKTPIGNDNFITETLISITGHFNENSTGNWICTNKES